MQLLPALEAQQTSFSPPPVWPPCSPAPASSYPFVPMTLASRRSRHVLEHRFTEFFTTYKNNDETTTTWPPSTALRSQAIVHCVITILTLTVTREFAHFHNINVSFLPKMAEQCFYCFNVWHGARLGTIQVSYLGCLPSSKINTGQFSHLFPTKPGYNN